jgi:hypothetical protein
LNKIVDLNKKPRKTKRKKEKLLRRILGKTALLIASKKQGNLSIVKTAIREGMRSLCSLGQSVLMTP